METFHPMLQYRRLLVQIDSELSREDVKCLVFLCDKQLNNTTQQSIKYGHELFDVLERKTFISPNDLFLLKCLLEMIGRMDLSEMLPSSSIENDSVRENVFQDCVSSFNKVLFQIHEELPQDDVERLRYAYGKVPRNVQLTSALDLFTIMKKKSALSPKKINELIFILDAIERNDLVDMIQTFSVENAHGEDQRSLNNAVVSEEIERLGNINMNEPAPSPDTPLAQDTNQSNAAPIHNHQYGNRRLNTCMHPTSTAMLYPLERSQSVTDQNQSRTCDSNHTFSKFSPSPELSTLEQCLHAPSSSSSDSFTTAQAFITSAATKMKDPEPMMNLESQSSNAMQPLDPQFNLRPSVPNNVQYRVPNNVPPSVSDNVQNNVPHNAPSDGSTSVPLNVSPGVPVIASSTVPAQPLDEAHIQSHLLDCYQDVPAQRLSQKILPPARSVSAPSGARYTPVLCHNDEVLRPEMFFLTPNLIASERSAQVFSDSVAKSDFDDTKYKMTTEPRGICLVINNDEFFSVVPVPPHEQLRPRRGSLIDEENLKTCFETLKFEVHVKKNLTHPELKACLHEYRTMKHVKYDCFICCVLSHGSEHHIICSDSQKIDIKDLTSYFSSKHCPSLSGKPKLFFLSCCQGKSKPEAVFHPESLIEKDGHSSDSDQTYSEAADFLIGYATMFGYASFRETSKGTIYVQALTNILLKHHKNNHLVDMLVMVNNKISQRTLSVDGKNYKQVSAPQITLTKQVWL